MKYLFTILSAVGLVSMGLPLQAQEEKNDQQTLTAILNPTQGNEVGGYVTFESEGDSVTVKAHVTGLEANSKHAIHIHQFGDTSSPDGKSAGGHFNPEGNDHALPDHEKRHAGDLGNLEADADGVATMTLTVKNITLMDGKDAIVGRSVVVHEKEDDGGQPTGNEGSRIAVGVIGFQNPEAMMEKKDVENAKVSQNTEETDSNAADTEEEVLKEASPGVMTPRDRARAESLKARALAREIGEESAEAGRRAAHETGEVAEDVARGTGKAIKGAARTVKRIFD